MSDYVQFREALATQWAAEGKLNDKHLFRVVRVFGQNIPPVESLVTGAVVKAFLADSDYPVVEYAGPNQPDGAVASSAPISTEDIAIARLELEQQALDQRREQLQPQKSKGGRPTKEAENLKAELEQKTAESEAKDAELSALKAEMEQLKAQQSLQAGHSPQEGQQHG